MAKIKYHWPVKKSNRVDHWFALKNEALIEISILHDGQRRKEANVPYIAHPFAVFNMLADMGFADYVQLAGLFHDGLEDTSMNERINSWRYGARTMVLVKVLTEIPKSHPWIKRKKDMIKRLLTAAPEVKVIKACDILDNLQSSCRALRAEGIREGEDCSQAQVWENFTKGYKWQKWYYQEIAKAIVANLPDIDNLPIVFGKLVRLVEVTFGEDFLDPKTRKLFNDRLIKNKVSKI